MKKKLAFALALGAILAIPTLVAAEPPGALLASAAERSEAIVWSDNFDAYATGSQLHGQGGWKGWFNDPAGGALTSSAQARSAPNSAAILGASDLVHEYSGATSGQWVYTAWQYVPSDYTGQSYFILLNSYDDAGASLNWSVQVQFDAATNTVLNDGGVSGGSLPLVRGQWVQLRLEIDLDTDTGAFYYGNQLLYSGTWSGQVSGGGAVNIAAVDLFANGASVIYYDDMSLEQPGPDIDVDPLALANTQAPDTTAQLALTIANVGDADLDWTIGEEPGSPEAPVSFVVDDGVGENAIGLTNGGQFLWLNRFTPAPAFFPIELDQVQVMFNYPGGTSGINVGELVDIYLYADADGNPANGATFVASLLNQQVQAVDGATWSVFDLPAPVTFNGPGDILIAVVNRTAGIAAGTFVATLDQTASQGRSWIGLGTGATDNPPVLPPATFGTVDSFGFPGNMMVRGYGETNAPCLDPADVPWLSVSPAAGTTAPAASTPVAVTLDSTGLATGIYLANLCIASDDPTPGPGNGTELVVVPVELTVEDSGPVPSVLEIPALGPAGAALLGLALAGLGLGALRRRRG